MPGRDFAHVQVDVNPHILCMLEGTFSLDAAHLEPCFSPKAISESCQPSFYQCLLSLMT